MCTGAALYGKWQQWKVPWVRMIAENLSFVLILGLYELFFFKTIIYNYDTMSSAQLNRYIVDGLAQCAS
jgi:galactose-1-phosphate uridylyltransferase